MRRTIAPGQKFSMLTALRTEREGYRTVWICQCVCGGFCKAESARLNAGIKTDCGCLSSARRAAASTRHGYTANGVPPEYRIWRGIKTRCFNKKSENYPNYGGRGIGMHEPWVKDFSAFFDYIGERPHPSLSIDRIDNDRGYEPGNLRWGTKKEQSSNKRGNHIVDHNGEKITLSELARRENISASTVYYRNSKGLPLLS